MDVTSAVYLQVLVLMPRTICGSLLSIEQLLQEVKWVRFDYPAFARKLHAGGKSKPLRAVVGSTVTQTGRAFSVCRAFNIAAGGQLLQVSYSCFWALMWLIFALWNALRYCSKSYWATISWSGWPGLEWDRVHSSLQWPHHLQVVK